MTETGDRAFSIGSVFGRAFGVMGRNPILIFGTACLLYALPMTLFQAATKEMFLYPDGDFVTNSVGVWLVAIVAALFLRGLAQGFLVHATIADGEGRRAGLMESLGVVARRFLPLISVSILISLGFFVGLLLLVVPGLIFVVTFAVAVQVAVEERIGVIAAFGRAGALTKGARWPIAGLWLLVVVFYGLLLMLGKLAENALLVPREAAAFSLPSLLFSLVRLTFGASLVATTHTGLYAELRAWKDGPMDAKLGEIFE